MVFTASRVFRRSSTNQTSRACERLQAILTHAGASFSDVIKQLVYVTDFDAYNTSGRAARAAFFGAARPASTGLVVRQLADPALLIEVELVADLGGSPQGRPLLEKYNAENHPGDFYQGVIFGLIYSRLFLFLLGLRFR